MKHMKKFLILSVIAYCVAIEAGQDGSKVLVTIDGKPLITQQQLDQAFDNQRKLASKLDKSKLIFVNFDIEKDAFLEKMVLQEVVNRYIAVNRIDALPQYRQESKDLMYTVKNAISPNYQNDIQQILASLKSDFNVKYFIEQVAASDATLQKVYNENGMLFYFGDKFANERKQLEDKVNAKIRLLKRRYKIVVVK